MIDSLDKTLRGKSFPSKSRYELIERLGRGGMGEVWKARKISAAGHVQHVAIKFLTDPGASQSSLDAEALRMSYLAHDNIVPFVDSGTDDEGRYFVAMAFVEGLDLDGLRELASMNSVDAKDGTGQEMARIPDKIVGFIIFMVLRALKYAHSFDFGDNTVGLVHRDISPGNILLDEREGFVKLSDFGVAAVQGQDDGTVQIAGKVPYMAPEVITENPFDCRVDIYALGLVAYELLTGFNPNLRTSVMHSVLGAITEVMLSLDQPLRPPHEVVVGIDEGLSQIIVSMLERDAENRYKSADHVMADLGVFLFERGYGPTTGSLADYLWLLRNPEKKATSRMKQKLRFLDWFNDHDPIRPHYQLTPEAERDFLEGRNPGREHC